MELDSLEVATLLHAIHTAINHNPDSFTEGDLAVLSDLTEKLEAI